MRRLRHNAEHLCQPVWKLHILGWLHARQLLWKKKYLSESLVRNQIQASRMKEKSVDVFVERMPPSLRAHASLLKVGVFFCNE